MKKLNSSVLLLILFQVSTLAQKTPLNLNVDKGTKQSVDTVAGVIMQLGFTDGELVSAIYLSPEKDIVEEYKHGNLDIYTKTQIDDNKDGFVEGFVYTIESFEPHTGKLLQEIRWMTQNQNDTTFSKTSSKERTEINVGENYLDGIYEKEVIKKTTTIKYSGFWSVKTYAYWSGSCYIRLFCSEGDDFTSYESSFNEMHFDFYGRPTWERIFSDKNDDTYFEDKTSHFFLTDSTSVLKLDKSLIAKKYDKKSEMEVSHTTKTDLAVKRVYGHDMYLYIKNIHIRSQEKMKLMIKRYF